MPNLALTSQEILEKIKEIQARQQKFEYKPNPPIIGVCCVCGSSEKLQRHHVKYTPEEIIIVCNSCHSLIHNRKIGYKIYSKIERKKRRKAINRRFYLKRTGKTATEQYTNPIEELKLLASIKPENRKEARKLTNRRHYLKRTLREVLQSAN